jgi:tetratricopeptide (TPR) repeat protein
MADVEALRAQCRTAREAGDFELAAQVGQEVWATASDRNGWDAWNFAFSLRKLNRSDEAMNVIWEALKVIANDPAAVAAVGGRLASEFGWSAYSAELKSPKNPQPPRIAKAAKAVVQAWDRYAIGVPWTTQFCPVPMVVNRAMKLLKEAQAWSHLADLAAITDGDRMPDEPMRPDQADSAQGDWTRAEAWYTSAAKAFVEEERYEEAVAVVERGTHRTPALGSHCLRWLYFHGAKAAIGAHDGARAVELVALARRGGVNDWWMGVTEANAADLAGNHSAALEALAGTFIDADRRHVPPEFLCTALETASRMLAAPDAELATQCARVNRGIRESHGWRIPASVEAAAGGVSEPEAALAEVVVGWQRVRRGLQQRAAGTVTRLISEGSGFLRGDDGIDRYFSFPRGVAMPPWCAADVHVTFRPIQRFDRKSGVEKPAADDLEPAAAPAES